MNKKFNLIAIHILPECSPHIRKVLNENEWFFFNEKYNLENGQLKKNINYSLPNAFYSNKISINAIVGQNGSGKSSIVEIALRLINNLTYLLISKAHTDTELFFVNDLNAELYYEIDNKINSLRCLNNKVYLDQGNGYIFVGTYLDVEDELFHNSIGDTIPLKDAIPILKNFFFTIVNNYSFHAYNPSDYIEEFEDKGHVWLNGVFHKNDGYLTPLVLNPYRHFGIIDFEREKNLTNIRLASLFYLFKKEGVDFIPEYEFQYLKFKLDSSYVRNKYLIPEKGDSKEKQEISINIDNNRDDIFNYTLKCYINTIVNDDRLANAYKYLVYKTYSISHKYPKYNNYFKSVPNEFDSICSDSDRLEICDLVGKIKNDPSHITLKIRQTLKYIDYLSSSIKVQIPEIRDFDYYQELDQEYIDYTSTDSIVDVKLTNLDKLISNFPPPFYKIGIHLKTPNNQYITFDKMSSGERQFLFYLSTLLYHLKNLDSVIDDEESVHFKYVNIILEEVELYFHPEYQRQFISKLINYIETCRFNNLEYINILIVTHSPFILSDIPSNNILCLEKGESKKINPLEESFGANIYDILANDFFMDKGFIGDFAMSKIKTVLDYVDKKEYDKGIHKSSKDLANIIGDDIIKTKLLQLLSNLEPKAQNSKEQTIIELKRQKQDIEQQLRNLEQND